MSGASSNRDRFPELAELVDVLRAAGFEPKVTHIIDHDGNALVGAPPPEAWTREMLELARTPPTPVAEPESTPRRTYRGKGR